ncbi:N-6 DNA methylase [Microlunatus capsulatus]|uniref:site-specific DNA-methyltransferase (adenine-specific) n=1 Tax=Microlunatus capsulatus TaxID=99117 RepID=A0ABS4Z9V7_9ACTN|nr:class I SAM-dependent DNA methyltransferase [Microlunatus capsulatus]MBP2417507.1 type I restriction enzyme M protein [Microlunatus capsulatus]
MTPVGFENKVAFVWKVADKLRGTFKQHEYGSVMLPLLVLRRMDAVLAPTKEAVVAKAAGMAAIGEGQDAILKAVAKQRFYNTSPLTFSSMLSDDKNLVEQLAGYIRRLSTDAYAVMEAYNVDDKITRMDRAGILYAVLSNFADLDLRPSVVSNEAMGYIFEELLRKFSEMSNETAGEHYTPREVITLMVELLLDEKTSSELTQNPKPVRTVYDPAAGTGGMLMGALHQIMERNPNAVVKVYGQELNDETWAIAQSDLMMQDIEPNQMANGNSLTADAFDRAFDFILANPPYGVDWKSYAGPIKDEHAALGHSGRFGAGLPRASDGSLLFLQHMLWKMKPTGSRVGIVLSGSPLFSGQAGSGESEIRRWILENDWLEGIVALPDQMFYNTGISTYVWILTNKKAEADRGRVRLIDGRALGTKMRRSLGDKRKELTPEAIAEIAQLYGGAGGEFANEARVKMLERETFGFQRITVERPLVDENGAPRLKKGKAQPDAGLRDQENVPLPAGWFDLGEHERSKALYEAAEQHLTDEIHPYAPDAWIDHTKTRIGVEIPFNRQFYVYTPPRPVEEIASEIKELEGQIQLWMSGVEL